jgi:hypothetical protein
MKKITKYYMLLIIASVSIVINGIGLYRLIILDVNIHIKGMIGLIEIFILVFLMFYIVGIVSNISDLKKNT